MNKILKYIRYFWLMLFVIILGTVVDYIVHQTNQTFGVPDEYFRNKIIFGAVWMFLGFLVFRRFTRNSSWLAFWTSGFVSVVLQTKYFLQGYNLFFVVLFMFLHWAMFFVPSFFLFRKYKELILYKV